MNFRDLLIKLENLTAKKFTTRDVAYHLSKPVKEVSNDLRRIHQMGFLKRKRMKRLCLSKNGKVCYRGYEFIYSISAQGRSYLKWMREQKPIEDLTHVQLTMEVLDHLPKRLKNKLLIYVAARSLHKYRGPNRNFKLIDTDALPIAYLLSENQRLAIENNALSLAIAYLGSENQRLAKEKNELLLKAANYMGQAMGYELRVEQCEQQHKNFVDVFAFLKDVMGEVSKMWRQNQTFQNILYETALVFINSRNLLTQILMGPLPKEELIKAMDMVTEYETRELARIDLKMDIAMEEK